MQNQLVLTTMEWAVWRYPSAELSADGAWVLFSGEAESVLPSDVLEDDGDFEPRPRRLRHSVGDAFDHFRALAVLNEGRADHLSEHVRRFGLSVLCRDHGLPMWHRVPGRTSFEDGRGPGRGGSCLAGGPSKNSSIAGVRVEDAVRLATFFETVLDLAYTIRRGRVIAPWHVEGVSVPGYPERDIVQRLALEEIRRDGKPLPGRSRDLVSRASERFLSQCGVQAGVSWLERRRPELVMKVQDSWGMYTLELVRRLSTDGERRSIFQCVNCGTPVQLPRRPRDGDLVYCTAADCRREKERQRKAAQRARKRNDS